MGYEVSITLALVGAAFISYLIADSFKSEDQRWYHLMFRAIFYMFSIGFVMFSIGAQQQFIQETGIINPYLNETVTGSLSLVKNMQFTFFVLVFIVFITILIHNVLTNIRRKKDPYNE